MTSRFFIGLRRICLRAKVRNFVFINCSLLVGIDCVTDKLKATFSWMNNTLFCPQIHSPDRWKSHFRALKFQNFGGKNVPRPPPPPLEKGDQQPLVDTVGYAIQTCWLLQYLLKPLESFNKTIRSLTEWSNAICIKKFYYGWHRGYKTFLSMHFQNSKLRFKTFAAYIWTIKVAGW